MKLKFFFLVTGISIITTPTLAQVSIDKPSSLIAQNLNSKDQYGDLLNPLKGNKQLPGPPGPPGFPGPPDPPDPAEEHIEDIKDSREDYREDEQDIREDRIEEIRDVHEDRGDSDPPRPPIPFPRP
ncbi:MAG: hypothetical protein ACRC2S_19120 [Waterburya sp.]